MKIQISTQKIALHIWYTNFIALPLMLYSQREGELCCKVRSGYCYWLQIYPSLLSPYRCKYWCLNLIVLHAHRVSCQRLLQNSKLLTLLSNIAKVISISGIDIDIISNISKSYYNTAIHRFRMHSWTSKVIAKFDEIVEFPIIAFVSQSLSSPYIFEKCDHSLNRRWKQFTFFTDCKCNKMI